MTEMKLKPCPFCGGEEVTILEFGGVYKAVCCKCAEFYDDRKTAAEYWNNRQIEDALETVK